MPDAFPVFDLGDFEASGSSGRESLGATVDRICRETGFLAIANHGVPAETIDAAWTAAQEFFNLPFDVKQKARAPYDGYPYGYLGPQKEALAKSRGDDTPPDLKESFNGGPLAVPSGMTDSQALSFCYADTIWPSRPEGFVDAWKTF